MRVLDAAEMRRVDRYAIEDLGIPSMVLMENAAIGLADAIGIHYPEVETVAIFCGPGNNGGDGLALARHLHGRGYLCRILLLHGASRPRGDAEAQLRILRQSRIEVTELGPEDSLEEALGRARSSQLVVDALFGTGLSRPLSGHFAACVDALAEWPQPCLAVDLPSGLDASRSDLPKTYLPGDRTVTFAAPKLAHVLYPAAGVVGEVIVTDLGLPAGTLEAIPGKFHLSTAEEMAACLLPRAVDAHKGSCGHLLLVAGSPGKSGAAVLAARAAVSGGAGLVTLATPRPLLDLVDAGCLESMSSPLSWGEGGLEAGAQAEILDLTSGKAAVALGPGLGQAPGTFDCLRSLVPSLRQALVLDADGLNAFAGALDELRERRAPTVLTPHPGEIARLLGRGMAEVREDRIGAVREAASISGAIVLLKGHGSLIANPDGEVHINPTGNAGMATGGSGDVLTGLLAALLAQGYDAFVATLLAAYLHGLAGDLALARLGAEESLRASDLVAALPRAFASLRSA